MEFIEGLKQHQLYKQFDVWAEKTSTEILTWAHPEMDLAARPESVRNAPLASFQAMFAFVVLYAIIVFVGMVLYKKPKASAGGKRETPSWDVVLGSFKKEPVKVFQAIYNIVQGALDQDYSLVCNKFDKKGSDITFVLWVFYVSKILDFFDTLFMVVRGKWAQFSFLHIYHHFSIFFVYWVNFNVAYDGDIYFTIVANGFIHFVMYYYYLLTTFGARVWWASHLTSLQLIQFVCMMSQAIYLLTQDCAFPRNVVLFYFFYIMSLFLLFANFFVQRYCNRKSAGKKSKKE